MLPEIPEHAEVLLNVLQHGSEDPTVAMPCPARCQSADGFGPGPKLTGQELVFTARNTQTTLKPRGGPCCWRFTQQPEHRRPPRAVGVLQGNFRGV